MAEELYRPSGRVRLGGSGTGTRSEGETRVEPSKEEKKQLAEQKRLLEEQEKQLKKREKQLEKQEKKREKERGREKVSSPSFSPLRDDAVRATYSAPPAVTAGGPGGGRRKRRRLRWIILLILLILLVSLFVVFGVLTYRHGVTRGKRMGGQQLVVLPSIQKRRVIPQVVAPAPAGPSRRAVSPVRKRRMSPARVRREYARALRAYRGARTHYRKRGKTYISIHRAYLRALREYQRLRAADLRAARAYRKSKRAYSATKRRYAAARRAYLRFFGRLPVSRRVLPRPPVRRRSVAPAATRRPLTPVLKRPSVRRGPPVLRPEARTTYKGGATEITVTGKQGAALQRPPVPAPQPPLVPKARVERPQTPPPATESAAPPKPAPKPEPKKELLPQGKAPEFPPKKPAAPSGGGLGDICAAAPELC